ncbi:MAG: hypothetical protein WC527_05260 [Candidatus Margulisiibacteriota bacterium]
MFDRNKEFFDRYTGREKLAWATRNLSALEFAAESLGVFSDAEYIDISRHTQDSFADPEDVGLLEKYASKPSEENKKAVLDKISQHERRACGSVWGSAARKAHLFKSNALQNMAHSYGFSNEEILLAANIFLKDEFDGKRAIDNAKYHSQYAQLTPEKYDDLYSLFGIAGTYKSGLEGLFALLEADDPDVQKICDISDILSECRQDFAVMGGDPAQLDIVENFIREKTIRNDSPERKNRVFIYTPGQLPDEVKRILDSVSLTDDKSVTAMDYVNAAVRRIIITDDMPSKELTGLFVGTKEFNDGGLYIGNGIVVLSRNDSAESLASTLFHEAVHARWERDPSIPVNVKKETLLNEGSTYLAGDLFDKMIGIDGLQNMNALSVANTVGTLDFKNPGKDVLNTDMDTYPTMTPYFVAKILSAQFSTAYMTINETEKAVLQDYIKKHSSFCGFIDDNSFGFNGMMDKADIAELVHLLPERTDEINKLYVQANNSYDVFNPIISGLILQDIDQDKLSKEIDAVFLRLKDPGIKDFVEAFHPKEMILSNIGRMINLLSMTEVGADLKDFQSVFSVLLKNIDGKYASVPYAQGVKAFTDDVRSLLADKKGDLTAFEYLCIALDYQEIAISNDSARVEVFDASGYPSGKFLGKGDRLKQLLEPQITIDGKQYAKIRYSTGSGYEYGYIFSEQKSA